MRPVLVVLEVAVPHSISRSLPSILAILATILACGSAIVSAQTGTETLLYTFCNQASCPGLPAGTGVQASDGNYYGVVLESSFDSGNSVIYRLTPSGIFTELHSFCPTSDNCTGGANADSGLIQGLDGNLYGTAYNGGPNGVGLIFKISLDGTFSIVHNFCSLANCADGAYPDAMLTLGSDGNFYGVTLGGAATSPSTYGSIFQLTQAGVLTTLYTFCNSPGCVGGIFPFGTLIEGPDGAFYGTTSATTADSYGDPDSVSNVYRITTSGSLTVLHTFCNPNDTSCPDGDAVYSGVTMGTDGYLYGSSTTGGATGYGTLYKVSTTGASFSVLSNYCAVTNSGTDCADGDASQGPLLLASDGNLYGLSTQGGMGPYIGNAGVGGVLFQVAPGGSRTPVYNFCSLPNCADGAETEGITQGSDGTFYGSTNQGGADGTGVVFRMADTPALPAPVTVSLSPTTIQPGQSATLTWNVNSNLTINPSMEQCFATSQAGGGSWSGILTGASTENGYGGTATISPTAVGKYTYGVTCGGVTSGFGTLTYGTPAITTTTLSVNATPLQIGQVATVTAAVAASGNGVAPTGNVNFYLDGSYFGSSLLSANGTATFSIVIPDAIEGTYSVSAAYVGDPADLASNSNTLSVTVNAAQTVGTITLNPSQPSNFTAEIGITVNLARLAGNTLPAGGTVTLFMNGSEVAQLPVYSGRASIQAPVQLTGLSSYTFTCSYSGDNSDLASNCTPLTVQVDYGVSLGAVPTVNGSTITVAVTTDSDTVPTGTITLTYENTVYASFPLVNGSATHSQSIADLPNGDYVVGVNYLGDADHTPASTSILLVCDNGCTAYQVEKPRHR